MPRLHSRTCESSRERSSTRTMLRSSSRSEPCKRSYSSRPPASGGRGANAGAALKDLRVRARTELDANHAEELLALRAVQTELFVEAVRGWEREDKVDRELRELGGDFVELATRSAWIDGRRVTLEDEELGLLFRMRWNDLTGLGATQPFTARLDEYRDRYALLLRHPSGENTAVRLKRQLRSEEHPS